MFQGISVIGSSRPMSECHFIKTDSKTLVAMNDSAVKLLKRCKLGSDILMDGKVPRNYEFHKKIFRLIKFAFDNLELPEVEYKGVSVRPTLDSFKSNLIVRSGFYDMVTNVFTHELRLIPHSISYEKCSQEKAEAIYSAMLDVVSRELYQSSLSPEDLERLSEEYMKFL